ncbi:HNH endonuclease signature motif containing protein [Streptomyces sp. NPDC046870]|uniref:HNH endonuclease n=1 Tax=Streptomyces sp. NPDC046870 TaxID=3155135 RepID=UPI0034570F67
MSTKRPAIPRELRRRVLIEAGHRCAIPTCRATPVEIAHITPWAKVKKHEFKNLIALCPTCHTRFDDPHNPLDRKAMRQYKANLNPLFSLEIGEKGDQIMRIAAYQDLRIKLGAWVRSVQAFGEVKSTPQSTAEDVAGAKKVANERFADALICTLDFQSHWKGTEADDIARAIFYHVVYWGDDMDGAEFPIPRSLGRRDIVDEISEASTDLHLSVCEEVGILGAEDVE